MSLSYPFHTVALATALAAALLAAGCGGGGGSSAPTVIEFPAMRGGSASAGADLAAANANATSTNAVRALVGTVIGGGAIPVAGTPGDAAAAHSAVAWVAQRAVRAGLVVGAARERAQAVTPITPDVLACVSGSVSGSIDDADNNRRASPGDSVSLTFTNCVLFAGLPAVSGSMQLRYEAVELKGNEPRGAVLGATLTGFGGVGLPALTGSMTLWTREDDNGDFRFFTRYQQVNAAWNGATWVIDWDMDELERFANGEETLSISGRIGIGGQFYAMTQAEAFRISLGADYPSAGTLRIVDSGGDAVLVVVVNGTQVQRSFNPASGGSTLLGTEPWSAFGG